MAKTSYSEKLQNPKWQRKRLEVFERDNYTCQLCNDTETMLQVHHKKYAGNPWDVPLKDLITYCKHCHAVIEDKNEERNYIFHILKRSFPELNRTMVCIFYVSPDNSNHVDFYCYNESTSNAEYLITLTANSIEDINNIIKRQLKVA